MKNKTLYIISAAFFVAFAVLIALLNTVDVNTVSTGDKLGLYSLNTAIYSLFGYGEVLYSVTELLGIIPLLTLPLFAFIGLYQLVKRGSLKKVDKDIIALGVFYVAVLLCYVFFEIAVVNTRPILIDGELEASFPSSHVLMTVCFLGSAVYQASVKLKNRTAKLIMAIVSVIFASFMAVGRLACGVHWFTDILGGVLLGISLTVLYVAVCNSLKNK